MKVAFCITCKDRLQHLRLTLPCNLADNPDPERAKFVLLDYGSKDGLADFVRDEHGADIASGRLAYYRTEAAQFQMSHAKNLAHRCGVAEGGTILVNMDADNFTGVDFAYYLEQAFARHPHSFMWARMIQRCNALCAGGTCLLPKHHRSGHSSLPSDLNSLYPESEHPLSRGISGRIACTAQAFLKTGGYNEKYSAWWADDRDFNARLQKLGYAAREIDRRFLHAIHHSEKLRFREYPYANPGAYDVPVVPDPFTAVVNFGNVGVGAVTRNFCEDVSYLGRIPTRVFGVGMHKTATTSLAAALRILGFDSAHWETPRWARNIWCEMSEHGKSLTMERHYAVADFPITVLYRKLDAAYPGSKFILTIREENDWLRSVEMHWSDRNPHRASWDADCFSHRMHREVYGRQAFDAATMLARYRRHNAEVRAYFKDRPGDLLVLDERSGWAPLCAFLGKPVSAQPYPWENESVGRGE
jgi:hypothetical protein